MKKILQHLFEHNALSRQEAKDVILNIGKGNFQEAELAAFITVYLMRSISIDELLGMRDGLLEMALSVNLSDYETIDIVGTGGDGKNTFNISTLAGFIVAGAGHMVAKHGNYGASTVSGASNVMEALGYRFKSVNDDLRDELEKTRFTFLHAPQFHPALKAVSAIRRQLGFRSFFNMLGPMVNPASPSYQLVGVYNLEMARIYTYLLQQGGKPFTILHSLDGYDEISLTGEAKVITNKGEEVWSAVQLGKRSVSAADIYGGSTVEEAAKIFLKILKREGSWAQNAVVLANAAMALHGSGKYAAYDEAYDAAVESLESGKAYQSFHSLISLQ